MEILDFLENGDDNVRRIKLLGFNANELWLISFQFLQGAS